MPLLFHHLETSFSPRVCLGFLLRSAMPALSHSLHIISPSLSRGNTVRCRVNISGSIYSFLNFRLNFNDCPPTEMAPLFPGCEMASLFSGCDYEHWLVVMDKLGGEGATKQKMIDCYIQSLAKVIGRGQCSPKGLRGLIGWKRTQLGTLLNRRNSTHLQFFEKQSYMDTVLLDHGCL